jgi:uncharacterized protein
MRALLDVNVLIASLDADHSLHTRAIDWFAQNASDGWASCPITQNGCVRIMSHPGYPGTLPVAAVVERLAMATADPVHQFWPDDVSLLDVQAVDASRILGPKQITDLYLLTLAVQHGGRLVSFDQSIVPDAVRGFAPHHLLTL